MSTKLLHLRNSTTSLAPSVANLTPGQLAVNTADAALYTLDSANQVKKVADATILANTLTIPVANTYGIVGTAGTISNLDTFASTGFYYCSSTAGGTFPPTGAVNGIVLVCNNTAATGIVQIFTALGGSFDGSVYTRRFVSAAWSSWIKLYSTLNTGSDLVKTINGLSPTNTGDFTINTKKNKLLNGRFRVWQRAVPASGAISGFIADRWFMSTAGATVSIGSATTFPLDSPNYLVWQETAGTGTPYISQSVENIGINQNSVTVISFLANPSKTMTITPIISQNFGTGGSATVITTGTPITLTANSWVRYSQQLTIPSITGKTIGATSYIKVQFATATTPGTFTLNLAELQWEPGLNFTGYENEDLAETSAKCLHYYERFQNSSLGWAGQLANTSVAQMSMFYTRKYSASPTITFSNVVQSGLTNTTITVSATSRSSARLSLPSCNQLLGALCSITFDAEVNAELPTA